MSEKLDFLVEIGTEELPPKALKRLSQAFAEGVHAGLDKIGLSHHTIEQFATPRRLALLVKQMQTSQADKKVQRRGPALQASFDEEGNPTKAASGFAKSCGVDSVNDLDRLETKKGAWLVYETNVKGQLASALLPSIIEQALDKLPIPKRMRWGANSAQFVRPVQWIVMILGQKVIDAHILTVDSQHKTRGHRFHSPGEISLSSPESYAETLKNQGQVIVGFEDRRQLIIKQVEALAKQVKGQAVIDDELLDEVTSMVEWPVAVLGNFESRFLELPSEVLITTMKTHQKYFYLLDNKNQLLPHFITVSNIESKDISKVRQGNERVVRPRLEDAVFFWKQDQKIPLSEYQDRLKQVVFQTKLGSLHDKVGRIENLANEIAIKLDADTALAKRAARLCKCDLMTDMVGEFPSLQGIMGEYYAKLSKEKPEVASAIEEHYRPRFSGDHLPQTQTGQIIAIADKMDTLGGIFSIGQIPTGDKDPFGLRRAALGVLRTLVEGELNLDLAEVIEQTLHNYSGTLEPANIPGISDTLYQFMMDRLRAYYLDQGIANEVFEAVLTLRPTNPYDFGRRLKAVAAFTQLPEAESLAVANKRIANILKKADGQFKPGVLKTKYLVEDAERTLSIHLTRLEKSIKPVMAAKEYQKALTQLAGLRTDVDTFFDNVMVMDEDKELRQNRLALLAKLRGLFLQVADISRLQID